MSFSNAPATCRCSVDVVRLSPNRPITVACCSGSHTRLTRPEMPSPSASSGSASAAQRRLGDRLEEAEPDHAGRLAIRHPDVRPGRNEPSGSSDVDPRLAQLDDLAVAVHARVLDPRQRHAHLGQADGRVVLELRAEARHRDVGRRDRRARRRSALTRTSACDGSAPRRSSTARGRCSS